MLANLLTSRSWNTLQMWSAFNTDDWTMTSRSQITDHRSFVQRRTAYDRRTITIIDSGPGTWDLLGPAVSCAEYRIIWGKNCRNQSQSGLQKRKSKYSFNSRSTHSFPLVGIFQKLEAMLSSLMNPESRLSKCQSRKEIL